MTPPTMAGVLEVAAADKVANGELNAAHRR